MKQTICEFVHGMSCEEVCKFLGEIVRCRDCKWISKDTKHYKACYRLPDCEFMVEPDGFCAWAERRES